MRRRVRPNCPFLRAQLRCIRSTEGCFIVSDERSQNLSAVATNFSRTQGASLERQAPRRKCGYRLPRPGVVTGFRNRPSTSSRPASAEIFDEGLGPAEMTTSGAPFVIVLSSMAHEEIGARLGHVVLQA